MQQTMRHCLNSQYRLKALCAGRISRFSGAVQNMLLHPLSSGQRCLGSAGTVHVDDDDPSYLLPQSYAGTVEVFHTAGAGRGIRALKGLEDGDLLMVCRPLAFATGPTDAQPDSEELVSQLQRSVATSARVQKFLLALYRGDASAALPLIELNDAFLNPSKAPAGQAVDKALDEATVRSAVKHNAFGDQYEDLGLARLQKRQPLSHVGLWPGFALFNHSCAANTVHYVAEQSMVVRAVADIPAGSEVTISYLGREEFAPSWARQRTLRERFGFTCRCPRCTAEGALSSSDAATMEEVHLTVQHQLRPRFMEAVEQEKDAEFPLLAKELAKCAKLVDAVAARAAPLPGSAVPAPAAWFRASVYDLYEMAYDVEVLRGGGPAVKQLVACLDILDEVSRGSELHVFLACKLLGEMLKEEQADNPRKLELAAEIVRMVHLARYGDTNPAQLQALVDANCAAAEEFLS